MNRLHLSVVAGIMALASGGTLACSCIKADYFVEQDEWALRVFERAEFVAHAKVKSLLPNNTASLRVLELFKGNAQTTEVKGLVAPGATCGTVFTVNEEAVFMVMNGLVNLCGKFPVTPELSAALRVIGRTTLSHGAK
jgi:hypothetical protein